MSVTKDFLAYTGGIFNDTTGAKVLCVLVTVPRKFARNIMFKTYIGGGVHVSLQLVRLAS